MKHKSTSRRLGAFLLCFALLFTLLPTVALAEQEYAAEVILNGETTSYATFAEAWAATPNNSTVKLLAEVNSDNHTAWTLAPTGNNITLDLNGFDIDRGLTAAESDGFIFYLGDKTLTITDTSKGGAAGKITGGYNSGNGGAFNLGNNGHLTLKGKVRVEGNRTDRNGGGVFAGYGCSVTISENAAISNNIASDGGGVYFSFSTYTSLIMTGGSITGNSAGSSGGVTGCGTFQLSGASVIANNTITGGIASNLNLGDKTINVSAPLTTGASIGVTKLPPPTETTPVDVTGTCADDYSDYFFSDNPDYAISNGEGNVVQLKFMPTVATPTFSPVAGTYTSEQTVTLACDTEGATIRYTTDGSELTAESTEYTDSITVSATTTITAKAFKAGHIPSATMTAIYSILTTAENPALDMKDGGVTLGKIGDWLYYQQGSGETTVYTGAVTITSTTTTTNNITVTGGTHGITLSGVTINTVGDASAIDLSGDADVTLTLAGTNTLVSSEGGAGVHVPANTTLRIEDSASGGSLSASSGDGILDGGELKSGAGIGGNVSEAMGTIIINGGAVTAISRPRGSAGIGQGGWGGSGGSITINGGRVKSTFIDSGEGSFKAATITITGGMIEVSDNKLDNVSKTNCFFVKGAAATVYGAYTLTSDYTLPEGGVLTIAPNMTLNVAAGVTLTNNETIVNGGTIDNDGTIAGAVYNYGGSVTDNVTVTEFHRVTVTIDPYIVATGLIDAFGDKWIQDTTGSATISAIGGYTVSDVTATSGTITANEDDGTYTLTGVTADTALTATATAESGSDTYLLNEALNVPGGTLMFVNDPEYPWVVDSNSFPERTTAKSNTRGISNASASISLSVVGAQQGQVLFYDYYVSSERSGDELIFWVNSSDIYYYSGTEQEEFQTAFYIIPEDGSYTFTWTYSKDGSDDDGGDAAWIDNIELMNASTKSTTITLDNGDGETYDQSVTFGALNDPITPPTGSPEDGMAFAGYYTATGGEGERVIKANGAFAANAAGYTDELGRWICQEETLTLYAHWTVSLSPLLNIPGGTLVFVNDPDYPWIVDDDSFPGRTTAKSNIAGIHGASASISLSAVEAKKGQVLLFDYYVSSENHYDKLTFGVANDTRSYSGMGQKEFQIDFYIIPEDGDYTFTWTYSKDSSVNGGRDSAWIDNVRLLDESYSLTLEASEGGVLVRADGIGQFTAMVARYDDGRMTAAEVIPITGLYSETLTLPGSGSEYRAFALDSNYAPLCEAARLE